VRLRLRYLSPRMLPGPAVEELGWSWLGLKFRADLNERASGDDQGEQEKMALLSLRVSINYCSGSHEMRLATVRVYRK
jgi:hypothetical protein